MAPWGFGDFWYTVPTCDGFIIVNNWIQWLKKKKRWISAKLGCLRVHPGFVSVQYEWFCCKDPSQFPSVSLLSDSNMNTSLYMKHFYMSCVLLWACGYNLSVSLSHICRIISKFCIHWMWRIVLHQCFSIETGFHLPHFCDLQFAAFLNVNELHTFQICMLYVRRSTFPAHVLRWHLFRWPHLNSKFPTLDGFYLAAWYGFVWMTTCLEYLIPPKPFSLC